MKLSIIELKILFESLRYIPRDKIPGFFRVTGNNEENERKNMDGNGLIIILILLMVFIAIFAYLLGYFH